MGGIGSTDEREGERREEGRERRKKMREEGEARKGKREMREERCQHLIIFLTPFNHIKG